MQGNNSSQQSDFVYIPPRDITSEDYEELQRLGYGGAGFENISLFKIKTCSSGANKGREFWVYEYLFLFWDNDKKPYNPQEHERKVEKRKRDVEVFTSSKKLKSEFDYKKALLTIELQSQIETLTEEVNQQQRIIRELQQENEMLTESFNSAMNEVQHLKDEASSLTESAKKNPFNKK